MKNILLLLLILRLNFIEKKKSKTFDFKATREPEFSVIDGRYFYFNLFSFEIKPPDDVFRQFWLEKARYVQTVEKEKLLETHLHHSPISRYLQIESFFGSCLSLNSLF